MTEPMYLISESELENLLSMDISKWVGVAETIRDRVPVTQQAPVATRRHGCTRLKVSAEYEDGVCSALDRVISKIESLRNPVTSEEPTAGYCRACIEGITEPCKKPLPGCPNCGPEPTVEQSHCDQCDHWDCCEGCPYTDERVSKERDQP